MNEKQSWVTSASNDQEGLKALALAKSLRNVVTRRLLTAFVSQAVGPEIRNRLEEWFDRCITMDGKQLNDYKVLPFSTVAKINCWNLRGMKKFVFIHCNSLALQNADELFKEEGPLFSKGGLDADLIMDCPSHSKFNGLRCIMANRLEQKNGFSFNLDWMNSGRLLDTTYNYVFDLFGHNLDIDIGDVKILRFRNAHPLDHVFENNDCPNLQGMFEKAIFDKTIGLFSTEEYGTVKNQTWKQEAIQNSFTTSPTSDINVLNQLQNSVAIVGTSFRFPGVNNLDEFWDLLINGNEGIIKVPDGRWNEDQCYVRTENTKQTQAGFLKCPIDEIDAKFFGLSPKEVEYMDPQQRLTLQIIWEGLEHAGINPASLKNSKTGVFGGWWRNDYKELLQEAGLNEQEFFRTYMGNALGTLTGRISHILELTGPSISTESGCSTSIVAVDMACKSLLNEDCDIGLAFGVNLLLHPFNIHTMNSVIAMDGRCKTFDANADGFGRAEGCCVLVLKRYSDAVRDGDRVWGLIRGSAVVQEGPSRSLGTPTVQCESLAMKLALEDACIEPNEVSFVETHGTGTAVGDPIEVKAVERVYAKNRETPLVIGSVKTNVGHTESCSGIAGIIKTFLALEHNVIPPHRNFETLNPEINLEAIPAIIPLTPTKWEPNPNGQPRIAGVSSFGITGTDAHAIIQESPKVSNRSVLQVESEMPIHILKISAKSPEALQDLQSSYKGFLKLTSEDLLDICYTANKGRGDFSYRSVIVGSDKSELILAIDKKSVIAGQTSGETPKICFLFTGQGSQYPGMAKSLYDHSTTFRHHFDHCDDILRETLGSSLKDFIWGDQSNLLSRSLYSQTSIFCVEFCLLKLWESWGIKPDMVLGHSLGEFAAAVAAGILNFTDALTLVFERSRLIDSLPEGGMIVVKENQDMVEKLLKSAFNQTSKWLDYAAINAEDQTVLAGPKSSIQSFAEFCKNNNVKTHILEATHAFHSREMELILNEYRKVALNMTCASPKCQYVSGVEGKLKEAGEIDAEYWVRHTREPVRFIEASKSALQTDNTLFLEIGPQPVLSALMQINADTYGSEPIICLPSLKKNQNQWQTILTSLANLYTKGVEVNWRKFYQFTGSKIVTIPFYPFQNKPYWFDIKNGRNQQIHPLVGMFIPNASQVKIFDNQIGVFNTTYLKDHVIGSTIIMPGAGFLEMCLVAGHASLQGFEGRFTLPSTALTLEDFTIEGPMALSENEPTKSQVVVTTEETGETRVTIYSKIELDAETHKWIRHASAIFNPYDVETALTVGSQDALDNIKSRCTVQVESEHTYEKFLEFGLKFGPTFQNLQAAFKADNELLYEIRPSKTPTEKYILHPTVIDSIFQGIAMAKNSTANGLQVPISVSKFIWHAKLTTPTCYLYCRDDLKTPAGEEIAVLFDAEGERIVTIIGATFIETNVSSIMSTIEAQRTSLPSMYQEIWREQLGPFEERIPDLGSYLSVHMEENHPSKYDFNSVSPEKRDFYKTCNRLTALYMLRGLMDLGWNPTIGQTYTDNDIVTELRIQPTFKQFTRYILTVLGEEGFVKPSPDCDLDLTFSVANLPPREVLQREIEKLYLDSRADKHLEVHSITAVANNLAGILSGKESSLPILFPEDGTVAGPAEQYYNHSELHGSTSASATLLLPMVLSGLTKAQVEHNKVQRILEVGAGIGSYTKVFFQQLKGPPSTYEYTYTDISAAFFPAGEKIFEGSKMKVIYKTLNIEEDPVAQGFIPNHYDIICASFVVHATKDIRNAVTNMRNLLRPGGDFILTELTKPLRGLNLLFGVVEGFWAFTDFDLRPHNCEMGKEKWDRVLKESGFDRVAIYDVYQGHAALIGAKADATTGWVPKKVLPSEKSKTWLLFSNRKATAEILETNLAEIGRKVEVVNYIESCLNETEIHALVKKISTSEPTTLEGILYLVDPTDFEEGQNPKSICEPFLHLARVLFTLDQVKVIVLTQGSLGLPEHIVLSPIAGAILGMMKALQNENHSIQCKYIDMDPKKPTLEALQEAFAETCLNDGEVTVAYRDSKRSLPRFVPIKIPNTALKFPTTEFWQLILPSSRSIQDLRFGPSPRKDVGNFDILVRVKAYSLNFRDVLVVLKPDAQFEDWNMVGIDISGIVAAVGPGVTKFKVGDPVVGTNKNGDALPNYIVSKESLLFPLPKQITFEEAATIPAIGITVYACLLEDNKLKEGDTILIHTGSGGVGLLAIQISQHLKCNIVTTAGSSRKRNYLKRLGIKHIFNSRNADYGTEIRKALNGGGVDFVLNSLTGPGFKEATLGLCKPGARFVEMSKLNIWTEEEVAELRPDIQYEIVDISTAPEEKLNSYMKSIQENLDNATMRPLPYTRFEASEIRRALTYLQKGKHIGKVICVMPEPKQLQGNQDLSIPLFNNRSTYLITGGLGGLGLEIAKWMSRSGAGHIVLVGRNPPKEKAQEEINKLNSAGALIIVRQCDVGDYGQCEDLLNFIKSEDSQLPILRGIMHAAGVLSDGMYESQNYDKYETAFSPKIKGGWNLHKLTLEYNLEHFVMFSSAAANFGSVGQSNHAAANSFLDCFAHYRHSIGLPATTINWGQWGQVGVAANLDVPGLVPMTPLQCVSALETILKNQFTQACICEANFPVLKKVFPIARKYLSELKDTHFENMEGFKINSDEFWKDYDGASSTEERIAVVRKNLRFAIRQVLKMDESDEINDDGNLQEMGMDSLMMIEMKNSIQSLVGDRAKITVNSVKNCTTVNALASRLVELISGVEELPPPTREELNALIREDAELPENIRATRPGCKPSEIKTVFITGVTGNLGPYVLREILKQPSIEKVYCLMRGSFKTTPDSRLRKMLSDKKMELENQFHKLECVIGSITQKNFGLDEETFLKLAGEVDAVFHLAAVARFQEIYRKGPESESDIRTVNVIGTKNILEFACTAKTKLVFHASATLAVSKLDETNRMSENWPLIDDFDDLPNDAYPFSKFIADRLMAQAVERGIPCKVFRFPFIGGDSKTGGNISVLNNSLLLRMMAYLHLGVMPALNIPFMAVPVDLCAELSTRVFFRDDSGFEVFNVHNPKVNDEQELEDIAEEFGYTVETIDPDEFGEKLATLENTELLVMMKRGEENKDRLFRPLVDQIPAAARAWMEGRRDVFESKKLVELIPEYPECMETSLDILKRDLSHAKEWGIFAKLGLSLK